MGQRAQSSENDESWLTADSVKTIVLFTVFITDGSVITPIALILTLNTHAHFTNFTGAAARSIFHSTTGIPAKPFHRRGQEVANRDE